MILLTTFLALAQSATGTANAESFHLDPSERAAVQRSIENGVTWLLGTQDEAGAFRFGGDETVCQVALSSLALWALGRAAGDSLPAEQASLGCRYLLSWQQPDGGLYDPDRGLAVYTSGIAAHAVSELARGLDRPDLEAVSREVELFTYRRGVPESWTDDVLATSGSSRLDVRALERALASSNLSEAERRALQFLEISRPQSRQEPERTRTPDWRGTTAESTEFCYEDLLPLVYESLRPEHQRTRRALDALRRCYRLDYKPSWTSPSSFDGSSTPSQGIFYYYCVIARLLAAQLKPTFRTEDGIRHDWPRELTRKLISIQRPDGSWVNRDLRWWEGQPVLATSYALLALSACVEMQADRP